MYEDYSRGCITKISVVPEASYNFCDSDKYGDCPFYRIINNIGTLCENINKCPAYAYFQVGEFEEFLKLTKQYCLSENKVNCERYKIKNAGKEVPKDLHPNGSKIIKEA